MGLVVGLVWYGMFGLVCCPQPSQSTQGSDSDSSGMESESTTGADTDAESTKTALIQPESESTEDRTRNYSRWFDRIESDSPHRGRKGFLSLLCTSGSCSQNGSERGITPPFPPGNLRSEQKISSEIFQEYFDQKRLGQPHMWEAILAPSPEDR